MPKAANGTLDTFIVNKSPRPEPVATSQEIRDRGSLFVANLYRATTIEEAKAFINHLKYYVHRDRKATHEISAWRMMVLKTGKTGCESPADFELVQGSKDDGESWAGGKILKVMQNLAIIDAVVIVSRWYGGTLLGPARFSHIETCATEVCKIFKQVEELQDCITTLRILDETLADLRKELAEAASKGQDELPASSQEPGSAITDPESTTSASDLLPEARRAIPEKEEGADGNIKPKAPDYSNLDVAKAKRLIKARESSVKSVRALIEKKAGQR